MKLAKVEYSVKGQIQMTEMFVIKTADDLKEFGEAIRLAAQKITRKLIASPKLADIHYVSTFKGIEFALMSPSVTVAGIRGISIIEALAWHVDRYFHGVAKYLLRGETVLLNKNGGYRAAAEDCRIVEIIDNRKLVGESVIAIKDATSVLNIENDPELEKNAIKRLESLDAHYSYITDLRSLTQDELLAAFQRFVNKGGKTLYVYTTGSDVNQAALYIKTAEEAGIEKFLFEFSCTPPIFFKKMLDDLKVYGADIEILAQDLPE